MHRVCIIDNFHHTSGNISTGSSYWGEVFDVLVRRTTDHSDMIFLLNPAIHGGGITDFAIEVQFDEFFLFRIMFFCSLA